MHLKILIDINNYRDWVSLDKKLWLVNDGLKNGEPSSHDGTLVIRGAVMIQHVQRRIEG